MSTLFQLTRLSVPFKITSSIAIAALLSFSMMSNNVSAAETSTPATASPTPPTVQNKDADNMFAERKEKELVRIAKHLQILQTLQTCVKSADDPAAMKACHKAARTSAQPAHS